MSDNAQLNDGLIIGIDIQKIYSQVSWYNNTDNTCEPVNAGKDSFVENPKEVCELFNIPQGLDYDYTKELADFIAGLIGQVKSKCGRMKVEKICITVEVFEKYILDRISSALESLRFSKEQWFL